MRVILPEWIKTDAKGLWLGKAIPEQPVPSEAQMTKLLAIINKRPSYNMQELAKHCRNFTGRAKVEGEVLLSR